MPIGVWILQAARTSEVDNRHHFRFLSGSVDFKGMRPQTDGGFGPRTTTQWPPYKLGWN